MEIRMKEVKLQEPEHYRLAIERLQVNPQTIEKNLIKNIKKEEEMFATTAESRVLDAILTTMDNVVFPKVEIVMRSINASSGYGYGSVKLN